MYEKHFELLGYPVRDAVTGIFGVVSAVSFDVAGCVQGLVSRGVDKEGKWMDSLWFDTKRLIRTGGERVMAAPSFGAPPGGQSMPAGRGGPVR